MNLVVFDHYARLVLRRNKNEKTTNEFSEENSMEFISFMYLHIAVIAIADETSHTMVRLMNTQMLNAETKFGEAPVARRPPTFALGHPKDSLSHQIWGLPLSLGSPSWLLGFPRLFLKTKQIPSLIPLFTTLILVLRKAQLEIRLDEHTLPLEFSLPLVSSRPA